MLCLHLCVALATRLCVAFVVVISSFNVTGLAPSLFLSSCSSSPSSSCHRYRLGATRDDDQSPRVLVAVTERLQSYSTSDGSPIPPPPDPRSNPEDDGFRFVRRNLPLAAQHYLRDAGVLRFVVDDVLTPLTSISEIRNRPGLLAAWTRITFPWTVPWFERWDRSSRSLDGALLPTTSRRSRFGFRRVAYDGKDGASHPRRVVDVLTNDTPDPRLTDSVVCIVHGGAYGSGGPGTYRLCATPFLEAGHGAVVIVGYRTWPDADVEGQVDDVECAVARVVEERRGAEVKLVGHSSGAHLCALLVLRKATMAAASKEITLTNADFDVVSFVGLCGLYRPDAHYEFEKGRGVDQISPMLAACGDGDVERLDTFSTTEVMKRISFSGRQFSMPDMFLLHGVDDSTVPYTASAELVEELSLLLEDSDDDATRGEVKLVLAEGVGHVDPVTNLFYRNAQRRDDDDDTTTDIVLEWVGR